MKLHAILGNLGNRITMSDSKVLGRTTQHLQMATVILAAVLFTAHLSAETINGLWDRDEVMQAPTIVWGNTVDKPLCVIKSLTFTGLPYKGSVNTYSAFLAIPKNVTGKAPGVVLIHGGAGTAFSNWAEQWANKGYVAIAPDFNFKMTTDNMFMKRNCGTLKDMWTYHSVAAVMRAVSVVSQQPETNPEKIAMMGISWGGYLTCIASSIDTRVKVAIPVYGCGFYDSAESPGAGWHGALTDIDLTTMTSKSEQDEWIQAFDCKQYLPQMDRPIFFITGTGDGYFPMNTHYKSIQLPKGDKYFRVLPNWGHSYDTPWNAPEPIAFANQYLQGATPLVTFTGQGKDGNTAWVTYASDVDISGSSLVYTTDTTSGWASRPWITANASVDKTAKKISASLPDGTAAYFFTVNDSRGYITTSAMQVPIYTALPVPPQIDMSKKLNKTGFIATAITGPAPIWGMDGFIDFQHAKEHQEVGDWYLVDMQSPRQISMIMLHSKGGGFPRGYAVTVSNDGTNWGTPVATGNGTGSTVMIPLCRADCPIYQPA